MRRNEAQARTFRRHASVPRSTALLGRRMHDSGCGCALRVHLRRPPCSRSAIRLCCSCWPPQAPPHSSSSTWRP